MSIKFASVSVVVPVLNGSHLIGEALDSVVRQSVMPSEIIVVDGGSVDDSRHVVESFSQRSGVPSISFWVHEQPGAACKRNAGVGLSKGDYLAFLDADDIWPDDRIEKLILPFVRDPTLDCVTGCVQQFQTITNQNLSDRVLGAPVATRLPSAALIKRLSFERVGPFDASLRRGETIEWWSRAMDAGWKTRPIEEVVLLRRVHDRNLGRTQSDTGKEYLSMLHRVMQRRRSGV